MGAPSEYEHYAHQTDLSPAGFAGVSGGSVFRRARSPGAGRRDRLDDLPAVEHAAGSRVSGFGRVHPDGAPYAFCRGALRSSGPARLILATGLALQMLCAGGLLALTWIPGVRLWTFYPMLALSGVGRAFAEPASQAVLPFLVPAERLASAIAWSSSVWQVAVIAGPALGGVAYAFGPTVAFAVCGACFLAALVAIATVSGRRFLPVHGSLTLTNRFTRIREGVRFVRSRPLLSGAISLDLVSVLLGGATALLPIYARDILNVLVGAVRRHLQRAWRLRIRAPRIAYRNNSVCRRRWRRCPACCGHLGACVSVASAGGPV